MVPTADDEQPQSDDGKALTFEDLRGLMKDTFDSLGGGEAFLRREREHFYESDEEVNPIPPANSQEFKE